MPSSQKCRRGFDTENHHEEPNFKERISLVLKEFKVKKGARISSRKSGALSEIGNDNNRDLLDWGGTVEGRTLMKPAIRIAHLYPILGLFSKWLMRMGHMTPPMDEPEYTIPIAIARFRLNQWLKHATDGKNLVSDHWWKSCTLLRWIFQRPRLAPGKTANTRCIRE
jgi:hypothetical protein